MSYYNNFAFFGTNLEDIDLESCKPGIVFLPCELTAKIVLSEDFEVHQRRIDELRATDQELRDVYTILKPLIIRLKISYPIMDNDHRILRRNLPENVILFDRMLGVNQYQRKRKRSSADGSENSYESTEGVTGEVKNVSHFPLTLDDDVIEIGENGTCILKEEFDAIDFTSTVGATRALLIAIFSAKTLATHTLTGKPSPAFRGRGRERPSKHRLSVKKVADIIQCITSMNAKATVRDIRAAITTKCADASKKHRYSFDKFDNLTDNDSATNAKHNAKH